jgi:hypothetical protein
VGRPAIDDWRLGGERYRAVHRSLLCGLLGNVARREDGNHFNATSSRKVVVFPGSTLFIRSEKRAAKQAAAAPKGAKPVKDLWLMAAEMVETTRLYARTCARLDTLWLLDIGGHILRRSYGEPDWNPEAGRVLVRERTLLHGLEIQNRHIDYGRIDPARATEIFLRGALVAMAGILTFPLLGVLLLATLYASVQTLPVAQGALRGMGAVAAGLITATGIKLIPALKQNVVGTLVSIGSIAITIIAIAWLRLPLAWVLLGLGGLTCAWAFRQLGRLTAGRAT